MTVLHLFVCWIAEVFRADNMPRLEQLTSLTKLTTAIAGLAACCPAVQELKVGVYPDMSLAP
jgi:hypothetical protein